MAIVDVRNKKRGITYVYESHSYWDKELKQPRSTRKLLGKRDPLTGEIVPTGPRGRRKGQTTAGRDVDVGAKARYKECQAQLKSREGEIAALRLEVERLKGLLHRISALAGEGDGKA